MRSLSSSARRASPSPGKLSRAMTMPVTFFLALAAMVVSYALGQGGPVAGLVFFTVLLIGAVMRLVQPKT